MAIDYGVGFIDIYPLVVFGTETRSSSYTDHDEHYQYRLKFNHSSVIDDKENKRRSPSFS